MLRVLAGALLISFAGIFVVLSKVTSASAVFFFYSVPHGARIHQERELNLKAEDVETIPNDGFGGAFRLSHIGRQHPSKKAPKSRR